MRVIAPVLTIVPPTPYHDAASVYTMPLEYHGCDPYSPRPCEPGILVRCSVCRLFFAPCTQTPVAMADVMDGAWRCSEDGGAS